MAYDIMKCYSSFDVFQSFLNVKMLLRDFYHLHNLALSSKKMGDGLHPEIASGSCLLKSEATWAPLQTHATEISWVVGP